MPALTKVLPYAFFIPSLRYLSFIQVLKFVGFSLRFLLGLERSLPVGHQFPLRGRVLTLLRTRSPFVIALGMILELYLHYSLYFSMYSCMCVISLVSHRRSVSVWSPTRLSLLL